MRTDVIVIGTGQAAVPLAHKLAAAGKKVVAIERAEAGGTCINTGCTPTKTMIASGRAAHVARTAGRLGVHTGDVRVDFRAVVKRKDEIVASFRGGVEHSLTNTDGITLVRGHARFIAPHTVEVAGGDRWEADTIVINTGCRPDAPPIPGLDGVPWLTNASAMALDALPEHLIVIGGGYIGCELGQMFRRLGARVTLMDRAPRLLMRLDAEFSDELAKVFRGDGIDVALGLGEGAVSAKDGAITVTAPGHDPVTGSHLLVATGRRPNTDDLGCDAAGIHLDPRGFIEVDDHYQTSAAGVYAVGDVTGQPQFTHTSWDDHRILADHLLGRAGRTRAGRIIPWTVFTDPQIAGVGLTEHEAKQEGRTYQAASLPFGHIARAAELDEPAGLLKVIYDPRADRLLGACIAGIEAGELVHVFLTLMLADVSPRVLVDGEMVHPTLAEGLQSVLMRLPAFS